MAGEKDLSDKTFTAETVAVLVATLLQSGTTLSTKQYTEMARLDGKRTASSFDHAFRPVKQRAKALLAQSANVGAAATTTPTPTLTPNPKAKASGSAKSKASDGCGKRSKSSTSHTPRMLD